MLHKFSAVRGFHIRAIDGEIGHVDDLLVDEATWGLRYLVVDTSNWIGGKHVLVSPQVVNDIDAEKSQIKVALTRDQIKQGGSIDSVDIPCNWTLQTIRLMKSLQMRGSGAGLAAWGWWQP